MSDFALNLATLKLNSMTEAKEKEMATMMSTFKKHGSVNSVSSVNKVSTTMMWIAVGLTSSQALAGTFKVDQAHSSVDFSVKHMMISTVTGHFRDFAGEFTFDGKTGDLSAAGDFTAKVDSIDTGNAKRDGHLKSPDFFDAAKCGTITIAKSKIKKTGAKTYEWTGDMTMHCVTKPVTFTVEHSGVVKDPEGNTHAGFSAKGKINRKDWGLSWNKTMETGGVMVGEDINVSIDVEAVEAKK